MSPYSFLETRCRPTERSASVCFIQHVTATANVFRLDSSTRIINSEALTVSMDPRLASVIAVGLLMAVALLSVPVEGAVEVVDKKFHVMVIPDSDEEGFEPHILAGPSIDGQQWYYVDSPTGLSNQNGQGGNLWISKDYGETWDWYDKDMATGTGRSGDSYTAIKADGTIYYTDLYLSTASVDWSNDGGESWVQNPAGSVYPIVDRQWFQIGPGPGDGGEMLYFSYNELASGLHMVKSRMIASQGIDWQPCNSGLPISTDVGSRDNFVVDPTTGEVYHANWQSNGIYCYVSTNYAESFTGYEVEGGTIHAAAQNTFIDMDVDLAGNVYMMWSSREHIKLGISRDKGQTWDVSEVTVENGTRVFPWIAAGSEGRIAMAWYDTNESGNPNNLDDAVWDYIVAISINALDEDPLYEFVILDPGAHVGSVRTSGLDGDDGNTPDRDLGDYIGIDIDEFGRAITVWGHDGDDGVNARQLPIMFARQDEGPFLYDHGISANFTYKASKLKVTVDASSTVSGDWTISNYTWSWGDGQYAEGEEASHTYRRDGTYTITLSVAFENGLILGKSISVSVEEKEDEEFPTLAVSLLALIILLAVAGAFLMKRKKTEVTEVEVVPEGEPMDPPPEAPVEVETISESETPS